MKKNKFLLVIIALCSILCIGFSLTACDGNGGNKYSQGLTLKVNAESTGYLVSGLGECTDKEIRIPNEYNGIPILGIDSGAFSDCVGITSVTIPDSVTTIGDSAFSGCYGLTRITIGNGVTTIGKKAFFGCSGLTNLTIPDSVTTIGEEAFFCCVELTSITIPDSVTNINHRAFSYCSKLASITVAAGNTKYHSNGNCLIETATKKLILGCKNSVIPTDGSVMTIGEVAFYGCKGLTSIAIPESVTSIEVWAFACDDIESITVAAGNTKYHSNGNCLIETATKTLIRGCKNSVIPTDGSVTVIGNSAFASCSGLTSIIIPDSVTTIIGSAFSGCVGITSVTIPDSVTTIGDDTFSYCIGLESIIVAAGNTRYHSNGNCLIETATKTLIRGCKNSIIPTDGSVTTIGNWAFNGCSGLTNITIPDSVTTIDSWAFEDCSGLTSIVIGNGLTSIDGSVFNNCSGLESITVAAENPKYHSNGNCIIETASKTLILGCKNSVIPTDGSVTTIGRNTFSGCSGLTSITIPDSVTTIGNYAFDGCSGLTSIAIGNGVTTIGNSVYRGCGKLTKVYYKGTAEQWSKINIDSNNNYLINATIYYYSETKPTTLGNYWHHINGKIVEW